MNALFFLALIGSASAARFRQQPDDSPAQGADKLKGLDPKTFGVLNGMMQQAQGSNSKGMSFLQYLKDDPDAVQEKLQVLGPIMDKLRGLDPKSFGALSSLVGNVTPQAPAKGPVLLQMKDDPSPEQVQEKLQALGPILDKLKGLDPKAFSTMSGLMSQAEQAEKK